MDKDKRIEELEKELIRYAEALGKARENKIKELSDDDIIQTYADIEGRGIIKFARAILRKAIG